MNILYITSNSHLRSTTCVLDAVVSELAPEKISPTFVFREEGPWQKSLQQQGFKTCITDFVTPDKKQPIRFIKSLNYWRKLIRNQKIDVIHVNEHDHYPMIRYVASMLKIPVIVGVRFVLTEGFGHWAFGGRHQPSKLLFTSHDQLERSKEAIPSNINKSRIVVLGNGRDLKKLTSYPDTRAATRESWGIGADDIVIGTASGIMPHKRIDDFINIVAELVDDDPNIKGVVAGGGKFCDQNYFLSLQELIRERKLENHVFMLGNIDPMHPFYQAIDMFISTSEIETFGMSVCEAMAFGLPVVAYRGGSVAEVLGDDTSIAETADFDSLLLKTRAKVLSGKNDGFFSDRNQNRAFELFDAPVLAKRMQEIYQEYENRD